MRRIKTHSRKEGARILANFMSGFVNKSVSGRGGGIKKKREKVWVKGSPARWGERCKKKGSETNS